MFGDSSPASIIGWPRDEERPAACPFNSSSSRRSPLRLVWPPVTIATDGVAHVTAWATKGIPPPSVNRWPGPPFSPSDALGVFQCATASFSGRVFFDRNSVRSTPFVSRAIGEGQSPVVGMPPVTARPCKDSFTEPCDRYPFAPFPSPTTGVGQVAARAGRAMPVVDRSAIAKSGPASEARGVGHAEDEEALALLAKADFRRAEEAARNRAAHAEKVSSYPLRAAFGEHPADVFDPDEPGAGLGEDTASRSPQIALVVAPEALSGEAVGLAGNTPDDAIHAATEASAREGSHITVDRRLNHDTVSHLRDQISDGECFPLHTHDWARSWDCQLKGPVEPAASGAQGDGVEGT